MRSVLRNVSRTLVLAGGVTLAATQANAQMKIGDNPSVITKSAILELSSTKQGLLLPRVTDFTSINAAIGTDVVDGMIVYLNSGTPANNGLYMRQAGVWVKLADNSSALSNWSLSGNTGTTAANYIGTTDANPLSIRTNGTEAISVAATGDVQLKKVDASTTLLDVLVIDATTGTIQKRTVSQAAFHNITANANAANTTFNVTTNSTTGDLEINAPVLDGTAAKPYGFLSLADWTKFNNMATGNGFTVGALITTAATNVTDGAQIFFDAPTNKYTLQLIAATATQNGIVTTSAQTFAGAKTFQDPLTTSNTLAVGTDLSVGGNSTLTGTLGVTGNTTLSNANVTGTSTLGGTVTLSSVAASAATGAQNVLIQDATTKNIVSQSLDLTAIANAVQTITAGGIATAGNNVTFNPASTNDADFSIKADATAKTVTFNLPNASAVEGAITTAQRGAVSTTDQSFAGNKKFANNVTVGSTNAPNSTLDVEGSVSMKIKTVTAAYTIAADDNTILANATAAGFTVTLPAPATTITGRIYTIKKIGTGDINNAVTINPGGGQIEGGTTYVIYNDWTYITVQTDGTNWYIIKK
jgi:hypothetical protein